MSVNLEPGLDRAEINRRALATDHLMAELGHRTRRGGMIAVGAQTFRIAIQFATLAILARLLLPDDFGVIAMAAAITGFVAMFSELGLSAATVQRKEIDQDTVSGLLLINLVMGVAVMIAVIAFAPVAAWFFDDDRVRLVVIAMALPIPLLAASRQHAALLQRGMQWRALETTTVVAQAIAALVAIAIAWQTDLGYWALVAQSWVAGLLTFALLWLACPWRPSRVRDWSQVRSALGFGLHLTGFQFLNYFHRQFDDVLIGHRWGAGELGYYNRAYMLLLLPTHVINGPVGSALVPALSRMQSEPKRWRAAYLKAMTGVTLISALLAAILTITAKPLVSIAYGPGWEQAGEIFFFLAMSLFVAPVMNTAGWIYTSLGNTRRMLLWALVSTPFLILGFLVGLPYGPRGVAITYAIVIWCLTIPCFLFATKGTPLRLRDIARVASPAVMAGLSSTAIAFSLTPYFESYSNIARLLIGSGLVVTIYTLTLPLLLCVIPARMEYAAIVGEVRGGARAVFRKVRK